MTSETFVMLSGAISFGVPMAVGVYELLTIPRSRRGGDEPPPEKPVPRGPKPLPDCLLPRPDRVPTPARGRILQDA